LDLPDKIAVPLGKIDLRANIANVQNPFAPFALSIEIRVGDSVFRRLPTNIEIEAYAEILVAAKDLTMNAKIGESDVKLEKRRLEKPLTGYLRDSAKLRGIKLIKNLASGAEITSDAFISDVVIRSGDLVRIVGQAGKLQITVNGEARSNGKIGDRIAVKNSQSNSIIQATVVDEGLVKVFF
jgi:flagellar basal body P-ring formation protein FlgA